MKPIDLQINISQMHEVAKAGQINNEAITGQQHLLEKESSDKAKTEKDRVNEKKRAERMALRQEERKKRRKNVIRAKEGKRNKSETMENFRDEKLGLIVDVRK